MVDMELQVISLFFITSAFPSFFNEHVTFITENERDSLLDQDQDMQTSVYWDPVPLWPPSVCLPDQQEKRPEEDLPGIFAPWVTG